MTQTLAHLPTLPPILVGLCALALMTGAFKLLDRDGQRSIRVARGPGGPARIAAALLFLYTGAALAGNADRLERQVWHLIVAPLG